MKKTTKSFTFYTLMLLLFGTLMYFILKAGETHAAGSKSNTLLEGPKNLVEGFDVFKILVMEHIESTFGLLLLQIIVILLTCRIFGWLFKKIGQPTVIGEITAGIFLGPSVLGHFAPEFTQFLFPIDTLSNINLLSQFGLILFMFVIGMELDISEVRKKLQETILISHTSTVFPFFLGILTAYFIYDQYAYDETPFVPFALFIGIAMSITAFPVLARIIQEKGLTRTHLGTVALASAANGDITAWCLLAVVVAVAQAGSMLSAVYNILFSIAYVAIMFLFVRPLLRMVGNLYHNKELVSKPLATFMFLLLLISSFITEILGLHALFGAFIVGMVMPENVRFRKIMAEKVEDVSLMLFLPLFFASTGLRTEIGLLNSLDMWILCLIFIIVAVIGKFGGTVVAARFSKERWKDSLLLGALMNTRGLMELVVLTIGYEMKILTPPIFVMLVLMTLVTTFMTTPLLSFINFCFRTRDRILLSRQEKYKEGVFKVLLSFGRAGNGQIMLDVAHQMFSAGVRKLDLMALHLTVGSDVNPKQTDNFERISFGPILYEAKKLNMNIQTRYEISNNAGQTIVGITNEEGFDFLLVGAGISMSNLSSDVTARSIYNAFSRIFSKFDKQKYSIFPNSLIQDKTKIFIEQTHCPVGIFVNRGFIKATHIIVIINSVEDLFLLNYAKDLVASTKGSINILNRTSYTVTESDFIVHKLKDFIENMEDAIILPEKDLIIESFNGCNFMLISYSAWNIMSVECEEPLKFMPSTLIIDQKKSDS